MLLLSLLSASRYSSPATHPTHPTCPLVCEEPPFGWLYSVYLCLQCCSALAAVATTFHLKVNLDPVNQFPLSIFAMVAPLLLLYFYSCLIQIWRAVLPSDIDLTCGFCYLLHSVSPNTFHPLPGLVIQYNATMLSIQMVTDLMGHRWRALQRFFAMFTATWPLTSSSLAIEVFLFDILDFDVRSPLATPPSWSTLLPLQWM